MAIPIWPCIPVTWTPLEAASLYTMQVSPLPVDEVVWRRKECVYLRQGLLIRHPEPQRQLQLLLQYTAQLCHHGHLWPVL